MEAAVNTRALSSCAKVRVPFLLWGRAVAAGRSFLWHAMAEADLTQWLTKDRARHSNSMENRFKQFLHKEIE